MVPKGWQKYAVGELCTSIVPGRNKPKVFDGDIPWVTTPEINGRYIPSKLQVKEGANKQVISSQADSLIKISRIWADFFPANTSNQPI
ncbi:hypothetical protein PDTA9759_19590 [Phytobacter diazotrophicus]|uniref:Type I restriction modification DNA specificity protein n=1 Tax=Phytobacter diazotrophicus TaxID=395631 RepID=A0ABM7VTP7_9ENTR|nr:hypothetical protein [Phytobacter diazotrophicus]BDD50472.1 hypothetical protein PDTA9734_19590 [Phytobacter diazotrophicus]BEG81501.1 hypothetical protein PDTA9730_19570 [Phytobacter diazotrophicus]BEG87303.1 hypothetical protein PDTA9759_19590 [Phytobacter diazotrophicus]BEG93097.1 hypothetical protein PDTA9832_19560 [Phytobacter diazotrophicus]